MITASAPGKVILFGEHAVVYGRPALAVPVSQVRATVVIRPSRRPGLYLEAPQIGLASELSHLPPTHPLAVAVIGVLKVLGLSSPPPCVLRVESTIPVASGLGSGAAVSVAVIRALSLFLDHPLPNEQINALAYEVEKIYHGTPSGIDNTVITYERPVYFKKGEAVKTLNVGRSFTLVIGDSGVPAPTRESVEAVRRLWEVDQARWEQVFDAIAEVVMKARHAMETGQVEDLGPLMNQNHALLQALTVSSPLLDQLVETALQRGALGAKLSGGGRGGNVIALVQSEKASSLCQAFRQAGAKHAFVTQIAPSEQSQGTVG